MSTVRVPAMEKRDACHFAAKERCINDGAEGFISKIPHITHHAHQMLQKSRIEACWICNVPVQNMEVRAGASNGVRSEPRRCTCTSADMRFSVLHEVHVQSRALNYPPPLSVRRSNSRLSLLSSLPAASHFHPRIKLRSSTATL